MEIIKCNKCNKVRKDSVEKKWIRGSIRGEGFSFYSFDLCEKCGKPLMKYFKKYLKIKDKK